MSITDELRKWASIEVPYKYGHQLNAIADRIDAEHEAMLADARKHVYQGYVELPKDANGEYIHLGDVMEVESMTFRVASIDYGQHPDIGDGMFWMLWNADASVFERADQCRHHHVLTVEDVLREMLNAWGELPSCATDEAIVAEYAAKLRLAGDAE